jgi:ABC-2 type transport system ATP-binding protein
MGEGIQTGAPPASLRWAVKNYGEHRALDLLNLEVRRGQITALLGPNGAGKSTTISLVLGLIAPDSGSVELFGESPHRLSARRRIGVMLQSAALPETLRVSELLKQAAGYYGTPESLDEVAKLAGVYDLLHRFYGKLSGGQQRRVQFALAICGAPEFICLDEPTTGLDTQSRKSLWAAIRMKVARGCAVLLTTHYLEEAEAVADRVVVLSKGRLVKDGTVDEIRALSKQRRIRCITITPENEISVWEDVVSVTRQEQYLEIETPSPEAVMQRLFKADPSLKELEVHRAGLADALSHIAPEGAQ